MNSHEIEIVSWEVSDPCDAVAKHLFQLLPAEAAKENVQTEGVAKGKGSTCKILICIGCFL